MHRGLYTANTLIVSGSLHTPYIYARLPRTRPPQTAVPVSAARHNTRETLPGNNTLHGIPRTALHSQLCALHAPGDDATRQSGRDARLAAEVTCAHHCARHTLKMYPLSLTHTHKHAHTHTLAAAVFVAPRAAVSPVLPPRCGVLLWCRVVALSRCPPFAVRPLAMRWPPVCWTHGP